MSGWVKLYRDIKDHWVYEPNRPKTYREAWEDIILNVNFSAKQSLIKGQLIECERGQSLNSLQTWASLFNWSIAKVRHFFKLLEKDQMITLEGLQYTTRLTVCNYETYQGETTDEKQTEDITERTTKSKPNATTKEGEEREERKSIGKNHFSPPTLIEIQSYFSLKIQEKGINLNPNIEAEKFESFYSSKNWMVGKNKMTDWKKAVSGWITRMNPTQINETPHPQLSPIKKDR